jgi:diguanylate cyclase (GGDEF)-like protein
MAWQFPTSSVILFVTAALALVMASVTWVRQARPSRIPFTLLIVAGAIWLVGRAMEGAAVGLDAKLAWVKIEYLGLPWAPPLWLILTLTYVNHEKPPDRRLVGLLAVIPTISTLLAFTNDLHGLIWSTVSVSGSAETLVSTHGPWFWVLAAHNYVVMITGAAHMLYSALRFSPTYRRQSLALFAGALAPILGNVLYLTGWGPTAGLDLTPFCFTVSAAIYGWMVFRFQLFELVPVAQEALLASIPDGVLVLDDEGRVAAINLAAQGLLQPLKTPLGQPAWDVFPILAPYRDKTTIQAEVRVDGPAPHDLDLTISPLLQGGEINGRLVVLRDISERVQSADKIESLLKDERRRVQQLDALRAIMSDLVGEFELDRLLDKIVLSSMDLMNGPVGELALLDPARRQFKVVVSHGLNLTILGDYLDAGEGLMGKVAQTGQPLSVDDYTDWQGKSSRYEGARLYAALAAPLLARNEFLGVIGVGADRPGRKFSSDDLKLLVLFGQQAALAIRNARLFEEQERLAAIDVLTGLNNRRHFFELALVEFERAARYRSSLAILMIDLDHFKQVNDTYGHLAGDQVLQAVAGLCQKALRKVDLVGRYGGEELVALMPETGSEQAFQAADRLRAMVAAEEIATPRGVIRLTVSVGGAGIDEDCRELEILLDRADKALYDAKLNGRNLVWVYPKR